MSSIGPTEIMLILALSVVCCGWVAHRRGRDWLAWAVLGFLLFPYAIVILLLLRPRTPRRHDDSQQDVGNSVDTDA